MPAMFSDLARRRGLVTKGGAAFDALRAAPRPPRRARTFTEMMAATTAPRPARNQAVRVSVAKAAEAEDQRLIIAWASVIERDGREVVDRQGDIIGRAELEAAAEEFARGPRTLKLAHDGDPIGEIVQSLVWSPETAAAVGVEWNGVTGWLVVARVTDDEAWRAVKSGELRALSIGGVGRRVPT